MPFFENKKLHLILLMIVLACTVVATIKDLNITTSYDQKDYFPRNSKSLDFLSEHQEKFKIRDDRFVLLGFTPKEGIFNGNFTTSLQSASEQIAPLFGVRKLISICHNCYHAELKGISGLKLENCISGNRTGDSARLFKDPVLPDALISKDRKSTLIYISVEDTINREEGNMLVSNIENILKNNQLEGYKIVGNIVSFEYFNQKIMEEFMLFFGISVILVCSFLWFTYRNWWTVIMPLLIILGCMVWSLFFMYITDKGFDLLLTILPTIVFIVGMSDIIHLLNKYLEELRVGNNKATCIKKAVKEVGLATAFTSGTTAIGFFSLQLIDIKAIADFGFYAGTSVIISYFFTFSTLPFFLSLLPIKAVDKSKKKYWQEKLPIAFTRVQKRPKTIVFAGIFLLILSLLATSQLKVNTYLLEDLDEKDPIRSNYTFFDDNFGGVRPIEIQVEATKNIFDFEIAQEIEKIVNYLDTGYTDGGCSALVSPYMTIKSMYRLKHNNSAKYYKLPKKKKTYNNQLKNVKKYLTNIETNTVSPDSLSCRISGRIADPGSHRVGIENKAFFHFIDKEIDTSLVTVSLTGTPAILDQNNDSLSHSIIQGLTIAFIIIAIIIGFIFKSIRIVLIALFVNILPLTMISGFMYLFNMDIKTSTALIFTLAFGIAVDDTIHLLSKLKIELRKGKSPTEALRSSYQSTGKAIVITSLILCAGFFSLIFSEFNSIFNLGVLVSITLFLAVITDLTVLPAALLLLDKPTSKNGETD